MELCGICCDVESKNTICSICRVRLCEQCIIRVGSCMFPLTLCKFCKSEPGKKRPFHCEACDKNMTYDEHTITGDNCKECTAQNKTIENRKILPHFKTKGMLDIHFIPEITHIIFDYYYQPRRYYPGEF